MIPPNSCVMQIIQQTYFFEYISPEEVYEAYMNPNKHSVFTGSDCDISDQHGGKCSMYDGYITAVNVELIPGEKIVQKWIANEESWPEGHFSVITLELKDKNGGTELIFTQTDVPDDLVESLSQGWIDHYWEPMADYFG